mmetsp:Transcript_120520/g.209812  ORF Transcript_120520/g.209812 Transcript_120520/m.209812 type:complete len:234 (+) Transcript_120520:231-932(+)
MGGAADHSSPRNMGARTPGVNSHAVWVNGRREGLHAPLNRCEWVGLMTYSLQPLHRTKRWLTAANTHSSIMYMRSGSDAYGVTDANTCAINLLVHHNHTSKGRCSACPALQTCNDVVWAVVCGLDTTVPRPSHWRPYTGPRPAGEDKALGLAGGSVIRTQAPRGASAPNGLRLSAYENRTIPIPGLHTVPAVGPRPPSPSHRIAGTQASGVSPGFTVLFPLLNICFPSKHPGV